MSFLFKIAWRNLFRNTRRTILASLAIGIGLASLIFTDALIIGMSESMIRAATDTFLGHGQIHAEGFLNTLEVEDTVKDLETLIPRLGEEPRIRAFTLRTLTPAMVSSAANVGSVVLYGIDPGSEGEISKVDEAVEQGTFLGGAEVGQIVIGAKLAESLEVELGDRIVVTVAEAHTGELSQDLLRVGGIFRMNIREMDGGVAFIRLDQSQALLGLDNEVHEVALHFDALESLQDPAFDFVIRFSEAGNEALGWKDLMPQLHAAVEFSKYSSLIVAVILFAVVSLGIMNTLFMSLYERLFEFGVLRAVGTRPLRMGLMVLSEAGALSILSIALGSCLGFLVTYAFSIHGIDYVGLEFVGVTFRDLIYPALRLQQFILFPAAVLVFTLIAAIYPSFYAARLSPAVALREYE